MIAPLGLALSPEKTRVTHIDEGIEFLGWRDQAPTAGSDGRRYVYTYPSKRSLAASRRRSGRSRGPATTRRSTSCCTGSTRCCGAGAPTSATGSPSGPSTTCAPTHGGGSSAGCDANTPSATGAGCSAATSPAGGRPTARWLYNPGGVRHPLPLPRREDPDAMAARRIARRDPAAIPNASST